MGRTGGKRVMNKMANRWRVYGCSAVSLLAACSGTMDLGEHDAGSAGAAHTAGQPGTGGALGANAGAAGAGANVATTGGTSATTGVTSAGGQAGSGGNTAGSGPHL